MKKAQKVLADGSKEIDYFERLDYCQAWTCQTTGYSFLVSYETIVAGYTATSAKHIAKFRNKFRHVSEHVCREV